MAQPLLACLRKCLVPDDPKFSVNPSPALRHDSILTTVGSTPLVKLQRMAPEGVDVYVKVEAANPMGSVKDRLALGVIEWALATGELQPGQTVVEASSGNTGIGLAMVCAAKGQLPGQGDAGIRLLYFVVVEGGRGVCVIDTTVQSTEGIRIALFPRRSPVA